MTAPICGSQDTLTSLRPHVTPLHNSYEKTSRLSGSYDYPNKRLSGEATRRSPPSPRHQDDFARRHEYSGQSEYDTGLSEYGSWESSSRISNDTFKRDSEFLPLQHQVEFSAASSHDPRSERRKDSIKYHTQRKPTNRDEFDGPHQFLSPPSPRTIAEQERDLLHLPTNLDVQEQDEILSRVNDILSKCAFDFVAKYQFPVPLEADKRQVRGPSDREWTEWVFLLKRLATKRRIPARVLYNSQIKQLVTILENSLEMRHAAKHQSRPLKDDRNVLQLISAGTQVAKILKDATAMELLDRLYGATEKHIQGRKDLTRRGFLP